MLQVNLTNLLLSFKRVLSNADDFPIFGVKLYDYFLF